MATEAAKTTGAEAQAQTQETGALDAIIDKWKPENQEERQQYAGLIDEFLRQMLQGKTASKKVTHSIKHWIGEIDKKLSAQLNEVMHHPDFQKLEGTWRGLFYLVDKSETGTSLKIRVLNVKKDELATDIEDAVEFDQSGLFKKVYEAEYGVLGGHPYGMLIGDYEFGRHPGDVALLKGISGVAAAAHAPFVAAASPKLFKFDRFDQLSNPRDLAMIFETADYAGWRSFRESEDSRYAALTVPHVLGRLPYGAEFKKVPEFNFEETVDGKDHDRYLWMNAAWAYGARITDAFAKYGWLARTRGVEGGGKVEGLPTHTFPTDDGGIAMKCPTEIAITDRRENELSNLGFMPLIHCKNTDFAAFIGAQSCQRPKKYFNPDANANAELSAKFNWLLCVSRFAHYLKAIARDKLGSFMERKDCEKWLNDWIINYVVANPESVTDEDKARFPLQAARIDVQEVKGRPGHYTAVAYLRPHFQLEALNVDLCLVASLPPSKNAG